MNKVLIKKIVAGGIAVASSLFLTGTCFKLKKENKRLEGKLIKKNVECMTAAIIIGKQEEQIEELKNELDKQNGKKKS